MSKDASLTKHDAFLSENLARFTDDNERYEVIQAALEMQEESARLVKEKSAQVDELIEGAVMSVTALRHVRVRKRSNSSQLEIIEELGALPDASKEHSSVEVVEQLGPPPGTSLKNVFALFCPPAFVKRELDALVADGEELYLEHLEAGNKRSAALVKVSIHCWLIWSVFGGAISVVMSAVMGKMKSRD